MEFIMNTLQKSSSSLVRVLWLAVALAIFTALAYLLMARNILGVGDLQVDEKPAGIIYFAAGCYLVGGLLILLRNRWLLLFGAFINAMVILFFFNLYQHRPAVMLSPGGLISKIAQILLEIALIYVLVLLWKSGKNENPGHRA
jgi:hypothetical protein